MAAPPGDERATQAKASADSARAAIEEAAADSAVAVMKRALAPHIQPDHAITPASASPTIPPLWVPYLDLKAAFLWLASNQLLSQKYAEKRWPGIFAELQLSTWYWRLQLPQHLESLRMGDGNIHSWKYLNPDWSDGTARPPTWDEFQRLQKNIGMYECYQMVEDWGLRSRRPVSNASPGLGDTLREDDLKAAVFDNRLLLEASLKNLHDRVARLARERARRRAMRPPQPSRVIIKHEPATTTHRGMIGLKLSAEAATRANSQTRSSAPARAASSVAQDPQAREVDALVAELREKGQRALRKTWIAAIERRFNLKSHQVQTLYDRVPRVLLIGSGHKGKGGGEGDRRVEAWGEEPHKPHKL